MKPGQDGLLKLRENLQAAVEITPAHLPREQLMAYAGGRLDEVDRELAESHFEICPQCVAQARDLNDSAARSVTVAATPLTSQGPQSSRTALRTTEGLAGLGSRLLTRKLAGAIAVLALLLIGVALWWLRSHTPAQEIVDQSTAPLPPPAQPSVGGVPEPQPISPPVLFALNDGDEQVTLDSKGNFSGLEALSTVEMQRVKTALQTGKVLTPKLLKELRDSTSARMGDPGKATFDLLGPVGRVVANDRPTFRWRPLSGAISYQVTITDPARDYEEIATSQRLEHGKWTVDRPLERGRVYAWQVTAHTEAGDVKAPEAAEAKFIVLNQSMADDLTRARKVYAGRRLVLGILYAEAGLLDEAERELKALSAANPQSSIAKSLLRDLQSRQRRF